MKKQTLKRSNYFKLLISVCILLSCQHELEKPSWNTEWTVPIAKSTISIYDLETDSNISWQNVGDNQVEIIYVQDLFKLEIDSLFDLPPRGVTKNVKLDSISFSNIQVSYSTTLGTIITNIGAGSIITNGSQTIIPYYQNAINDTFPLDASDYFQEMTLKEGTLKIKLENGLPTDLSNIELILRNSGSNLDILNINLSFLSSGGIYEESVDLTGQVIYGDLEVEIINVDMIGTGSNMVTINYLDALTSDILISNIVPYEGIAVFPEQEIFNEDTVVSFELGDIHLTEALIHSGGVSVEGNSTIQDTIKIAYSIPSATLNGQPFEIYLELPPAPVGGSISDEKFFDFSGYMLDLTGENGDTINTLYTQSTGWIDSSGVITHISLEDSIYFTLNIVDLKPAIAKGFLGKDTLSEIDNIPIHLFDNIQGSFDIKEIEISLSSKNYLGADGEVQISSLTAYKNNNQLMLSGTFLDERLIIESATESNEVNSEPVAPSYGNLSLNENNSNIDQIIEFQPEEIEFSYDLFLNPQSNKDGFLYKGYGISTSIDIRVPLNITANNIILKETVDFDLNLTDEFNNTGFILHIENGFPLTAYINMDLLDDNGEVLARLTDNSIINPGIIADDGHVTASSTSQINLPFQNHNHILENTKKIAFEVRLNTPTINQHIEIFSDYEINLTLILNHQQNMN